MRPLLAGSLALLVGCQEYTIDIDKEPPPVPQDTDVAVAPQQPDIRIEPMALDFGYLPEGCPADEQEFIIYNDGDAPLSVTNVELRGPSDQQPAFTIAGRLRDVPPGGQLKVKVNFTAPDEVDFDRVKVRVESNDPDEPQENVTLFGAGAENAIKEDLFFQGDASSVDVLWILDNSGSMSGELAQLAGAMQTFISSFENLGLDYHIGVVTTDMDNPAQSGRFVGPFIDNNTPDPAGAFTTLTSQGAGGSGSERGMDAAQAALTAPLISQGDNAGFLRADANLAVVVISDEDDDSNIAPRAFSNWLETMKPDPAMTSFSGMVGPDGGGGIFPVPAPGCNLFSGASADTAPDYHTAINRTGGVWGNICQFDVNPFLTFLSFVAAGLQYEFDLTYDPTSLGEISVQVDGVDVPYSAFNGWTYDPQTNTVELHGNAIPGPGASVVITYPFQTSCD